MLVTKKLPERLSLDLAGVRQGSVILIKFLFLVILISITIACTKRVSTDSVDPLNLSGQTMGTTYHLIIYPTTDGDGSQASDQQPPQTALFKQTPLLKSLDRSLDVIDPNAPDLQTLQQLIDQNLASLNMIFSTYSPDSELSLLNQAEQSADCITLSPPLYQVMRLASEINRQSEGFFDVTVGPAVDAWGFGPIEITDTPTDERVEALLTMIGSDALQLNDQVHCLTKNAERKIDLSALAKGYAVDQIAELLRLIGFRRFMVEIGGEVWTEGVKPGNRAWRIAIEAPLKEKMRSVQRALLLNDIAVASSGDYRNFYEKSGRAYSHTINPHTARPVNHHLVSVTVVAPSTAEADAWSTALLAMGPVKALQVANERSLPALLIEREPNGDLKEHQTSAMDRYLIQF